MTGFLLTALFTACAVLAFSSIAATLRRYGPAALRLHRSSRACQRPLEVRWTVTLTQSHAAEPAPATILRPNFGERAKLRQQRAGLRAAA